MKPQPKQYDDDDGRVICNMDVEGMPWPARRRRAPSTGPADYLGEPITRSEARLYTWYAVLAGLLVVGVFAVGWVLFILFCTQIWLR